MYNTEKKTEPIFVRVGKVPNSWFKTYKSYHLDENLKGSKRLKLRV